MVIATVVVGRKPSGVAVSPDCQRAYVTNAGSNTVSVIDTATHRVVSTIAVRKEPFGVTVSPDGNMLYVVNTTPFTNAGTGCVGMTATSTGPCLTQIATRASPKYFSSAAAGFGDSDDDGWSGPTATSNPWVRISPLDFLRVF